MSGFERSNNQELPEVSDGGDLPWPDDFSDEERQFAADLRELFPIEDEVLPPLYVQTLLEDEFRAPLKRGYVRKLSHRVMRRLNLPTRPLAPRTTSGMVKQLSMESVTEPIRKASRPVLAAITVALLLMLGSMYLATPSFAQGLRLLMGQTGAQQVDHYPTHVSQATVKSQSTQTPGMPSQAYWLGPTFASYEYVGTSMLSQQIWSNGQIVDVQYALPPNGAQTDASSTQTNVTADAGSGLIDIREFQVAPAYRAVLQAVQSGSATETRVDGLPAVYVNGMWVMGQGQRPVWQSDTRSLLIFQRDGVIFWITGDQRNGLDATHMEQLAQMLTPVTLQTLLPASRLTVRLIGQELSDNLRTPQGYNSELYALIPKNATPDGQVGEFVTSNVPTPTPQQ